MSTVIKIIAGIALTLVAGPLGGLAFAVGSTTLSIAAQLLIGIGISTALGGVAQLLTPRPKLPSLGDELGGRLNTVRQPISPHRIVMGTVGKVGGIITLLHEATISSTVYDYLVVTLSGCELNAIGTMYFDDEAVPVDGSGNATGKYAGLVSIGKNLGSDDQAALSLLTTDIGGTWTSAHRQRGRAHVGVRLKLDRDLLPSIPNIRFDVEGVRCYDRRDGTFKHTSNAALHEENYLSNMRYGAGFCRRLNLGQATLTNSGLGAFTAANVYSGDLTNVAFNADAASSGAYVKFDFGSGVTKEIRWVRVYTLAGAGTAQWKVRSSDDDAAYTDRQEATLLTDILGWKWIRVAPNGGHRYWRLELGNTPGAGPDFAQVELYESEVDGAQFNTAANLCDEDVALAAGGTEDRYTIDGTFTLDHRPADVKSLMEMALAGNCPFVGDSWKIRPGAYTAPTVELTESDFYGPIKLRTAAPKSDLFNVVTGKFTGAINDWQPANFPEVKNNTYLMEDGGERLVLDIELPFTTSVVRCQRIAKILLEQNRQQQAIEDLACSLKAWQVEAGEAVGLTFSKYGLNNTPFLAVRNTPMIQDGVWQMKMMLRRTASSVYAWSVEETAYTAPSAPTLPDATSASSPLGAYLMAQGGAMTYRPTTNPLTATDAGANATVSVAAHTNRIQGTGDKSINSGSVASLGFDTLYHSYYDNEAMQGGAVTYAATTSKETALSGPRRFYVGSIQTPKDGAPATRGNNDGGATAQVGTAVNYPSTSSVGASWSNPANARDGDLNSYAEYSSTADANTTLTGSAWGTPWPVSAQAVRLEMTWEGVALSSGTATAEYSLDGGSIWTVLSTKVATTWAKEQVAYALTAAEIATILVSSIQMRLNYVSGGGGSQRTLRVQEFRVRVEA
jgi:hypothetical protein